MLRIFRNAPFVVLNEGRFFAAYFKYKLDAQNKEQRRV